MCSFELQYNENKKFAPAEINSFYAGLVQLSAATG